MTDTTQVSDQNDGASGTVDADKTDATGASGNGSTDDGGKGDQVAYETYKKSVDDAIKYRQRAKDLKAEIEKRDAEAKIAETKRLEEQGNWKKIAENAQIERDKAIEELTGMKSTQVQAKKLDAVLRAAGGQIERKFWGLIDIDEVAINPETGLIDEMSVTKAVDKIRKEYPEIIRTKGNAGLPADAPSGGGNGAMSVEDWKKLPLDKQKELLPAMVERMKSGAQ